MSSLPEAEIVPLGQWRSLSHSHMSSLPGFPSSSIHTSSSSRSINSTVTEAHRVRRKEGRIEDCQCKISYAACWCSQYKIAYATYWCNVEAIQRHLTQRALQTQRRRLGFVWARVLGCGSLAFELHPFRTVKQYPSQISRKLPPKMWAAVLLLRGYYPYTTGTGLLCTRRVYLSVWYRLLRRRKNNVLKLVCIH